MNNGLTLFLFFIIISCNILRLYVFIYSCYGPPFPKGAWPLLHKLSYIYNIRKESNRKNSCIFDHKKIQYTNKIVFSQTPLRSSGLMSQNVLAGMSERRKRFFSTITSVCRSKDKFLHDSNLPQDNHTELNTEDLKALHHVYIKELYKDREAPVKPFDRDLILATCHNCLDKEKRSEFLKE